MIFLGKFTVEVGFVVEPANVHNFLNRFIGGLKELFGLF